MGTLYIVSTPIGNLEDITVRAIRMLLTARIIACEDTRRTGQLVTYLSGKYRSLLNLDQPASRKYISYREGNERTIVYELLSILESGTDVCLVTDAGTPLISDPGFIIIREALRRNIRVTSLPGPSSVMSAAVISGLPVSSFTFVGYPPEKSGHRQKFFEGLKRHEGETVIMLCAPHKLGTTLNDMLRDLGDISIVLLRELTKIHEERLEGKISEFFTKTGFAKGEIVLVFRVT